MNTAPVSCTKCNAPLLGEIFNQPRLVPCPACGAPLRVEIFPAMFRRIAPGQGGELVMEETEASCFYHPQKKAVLPCESCGRFMCALCDCVINGQHLCPSCIETGRTKGKIKNLENRRTLYDGMALGFAQASIIPYVAWLTAPAAIYLTIRHWNAPLSVVRRTKIRFILAVIIALIAMAGWSIVIYQVFHNAHSSS